MEREIGSEFHRAALESGHGIMYPEPGVLVFSGRTAIETILKELPEAKNVLLPSYCCDSMIEPFRRTGLEVDFYPVNYHGQLKVDLIIPENTDILVWCNYFGFSTPMPDLSEFINRGGVIIEDITHSLFSDRTYHAQSSYLVASLRKWEPLYCGGYCAVVNGEFRYPPQIQPPQLYLEKKKLAMGLKGDYLENLNPKIKAQYLKLFEESNLWLTENYSNLSIDPWSKEYLANINMGEHVSARRKNATVLYEGLRGIVKFLFQESEMRCPLFIPILLMNRDDIRKELIKKEIYCPVHWPRPKGCSSNLYDMELSLICDQRYNEDDMERLVSAIRALL